MKVALVYDRVNKWGGAERILLSLHKMFPDAPLYTSVYNNNKAPWAKVFDIRTSFLQKFPVASSSHEWYAVLMPLAFESFSFDEYDLVISVTSEAAKGIVTKPQTKHICICLTPTRYLWSGYDHYFKNPVLRFLTKQIVGYLRTWDKIAAQRPDVMIAISKEVQDRVEKYYGRKSEVIYPGVEFEHAGYKPAIAKRFGAGYKPVPATGVLSASIPIPASATGEYFLVVSRLSKFTSYKRVDLAIKAANKVSANLKVIGTGKDLEYFKGMAGETVELLEDVSDEKLGYFYKNSKALVFPGIEDFGLVIVESQLFGKPVIAFRGGGALEIIIEGRTGEFFDKQDYRVLAKKLENFNPLRYNRKDCIENAKRFSVNQFETNFKRIIVDNTKIY